MPEEVIGGEDVPGDTPEEWCIPVEGSWES